ncbi:MAG TPA: phage tail protein [Pyrinomonadaceae bacterium]|nr:phage tail protein [Pyrinomonadaceae bacterium]
MDANGSRFHLLLGRDDWARCTIEGSRLGEIWNASPPGSRSTKLSWNEIKNELSLSRRLFKFVAASGDTKPSIKNRRGAGGDAFGNWFWIDESQRKVLVRSSGTNITSDFWPVAGDDRDRQHQPGEFQPQQTAEEPANLQLRGLAVTEDHYLIIGVANPAGLLIFDLNSTGAPRQLLWPAAIPFSPFDMAPAPGGGVWILDNDHKCYWALDRHFNVINPGKNETVLDQASVDHFQPIDGSEARGSSKHSFPMPFSMLASPLEISDPIAIEALPDGTVLILDGVPSEEGDSSPPDEKRLFSRIYRYKFDQRLDDSISTNVLRPLFEAEGDGTFSLEGYDIAFVPRHDDGLETVEDRLYVASADGNQTFAFAVCMRESRLELRPIVEYFPMRLFGGKALVTVGNRVYYDFADQWLPLIKQRRPRYVPEATFETPHFDGQDPDCVWHRLMIDAHIAPETKVEVWSRSANEKSELVLSSWQREPSLYLRSDGSELPFLRDTNFSTTCSSGRKGGDTWELLFQRARGRYLQLRLRLGGSERNTPRLRALRAYYPRFSYLANYLPGVYREDEQSASFLDRYLSNIEGFYTTLEDKVAAMQVLFDVRSAPAEVLDWLASWLGVALDPAWDEERRRIFIKHAMEFFQYRGTIKGLTMALQLALDPCADESIFEASTSKRRKQDIRIVERYLTRMTPGVVFGDPTELSGPRLVQPGERWLPGHGRTNLNQRYTTFKDPDRDPNEPLIEYPITPPAAASEWTEFANTTLGFVPSMAANDRSAWQTFLGGRYGSIGALNAAHGANYTKFSDVRLPRDLPSAAAPLKDWQNFAMDPAPDRTPLERQLWQDFLARRYRRIKAMNDAYKTHWTSFETVSLLDELPADGAPLRDWYQFEGVVAPMHATAHQFVVLLPVPMSLAFKPEEHQQRLALSRRVIELEKPAHTVFDVKFYWAMFRIGEARLEYDTVLDQGSRALQLTPRLILGQGFLGESYLAPPASAEACGRFVIGQDPLAKDPRKEKRP